MTGNSGPEKIAPPAIDYVCSRQKTAEILTVSLRTLDRMESAGKAPARTALSDNRFGYRISAINQFLNERTRAAQVA